MSRGCQAANPRGRNLTTCTLCTFCIECNHWYVAETPNPPAPIAQDQPCSGGTSSPRSRRTRHDIHRAALSLASDQPVQDITVERIAEAADVSRRTFFNHFATKNDAFIPEFPPVPPEAIEAFASGSTPRMLDAVEEVLTIHCELLRPLLDDGGIGMLLVHENPELKALLMAKVHGFESDMRAATARRLHLEEDSPVPLAVANVVSALERTVLESWRTEPAGASLPALVHRVVEGFGNAMLPDTHRG